MGNRKKGLVTLMLLFTGLFFSIIFIGRIAYSNGVINQSSKSSSKVNKTEEALDIEENKKIPNNKEKQDGKKISEKEQKVKEPSYSSEDSKAKIAYLTFDDGPSKKVTPKVLETLKKYKVKGNFFVLGSMAEKNPNLLRRIREDGHAIYNHSYSHNYDGIYSSSTAFLDEVKKTEDTIKEVTGENSNKKVFRFPGGSFGKRREPYRELIKEYDYEFIDWNVDIGDGLGNNISEKKLFEQFEKSIKGKSKAVILMHDSNTKMSTANVLPDIIEYLKSRGYEFGILDGFNF